MTNVLYPLSALLAWTATVLTVNSWRRSRRDPVGVAIGVAFFFLAVTFTVSTPGVWAGIDRVSGVADLSTVIAQGAVVSYSAAVLVLLMLWTSPPEQVRRRIGRRIAFAGASLAAMVALFVVAAPSTEEATTFVARYAGSTAYDVYLLVYLLVFSVSSGEIARLCRRYAQRTSRIWTRRGLRFTTAGAVLGVGYAAARTADVVGARFGADLYAWELVPELCASLGAAAILIGLTLPAWGPRVSAALRTARRLRAYHRLAPLWNALYDADPDIALHPPTRGAGRWRALPGLVRAVDYWLARRVIEINDGRHGLRRYFDARLAAEAEDFHRDRGLSGTELAAAVEATRLRAALDARPACGGQAAEDSPPARAISREPADGFLARLDDEIVWFQAVADAFCRTRSLPRRDTADRPRTGEAT